MPIHARNGIQGENLALGEGFVWTIRRHPDESQLIRSAAFDGAERCLMVTSNGLSFWDGIDVRPARVSGFENTADIHFALRVDAGAWLVGGANATAALVSSDGRSRVLQGPDPKVRFIKANGDLDDILVFVGEREHEGPTLHACVAGHFLKPLKIERAAFVTSLSRLDAKQWLVTGRTHEGDGFILIYEPLQWEVNRVSAPTCRAYLGSATQLGSAFGIAVGTNGRVVRFEGARLSKYWSKTNQICRLSPWMRPNACGWEALDALWVQKSAGEAVRIAHHAPWEAPLVAIHADFDRVLAISASGGILEGRLFE